MLKEIKRLKLLYYFIGVLSLSYSCQTNKLNETEDEIYFKRIISNESGILRGLVVGDKIEVVKSKEAIGLKEEASDYLFYESDLNETDFYSISYYFDESGLYEMMLDVSLRDRSKWKKLQIRLNNYFEEKYVSSSQIDNYTIWKTNSDKSKKIEIALSGDTLLEGKNFLTLSVTNYDY